METSLEGIPGKLSLCCHYIIYIYLKNLFRAFLVDQVVLDHVEEEEDQ